MLQDFSNRIENMSSSIHTVNQQIDQLNIIVFIPFVYQVQFQDLVNSSLDDDEKLNIYYQLNDRLINLEEKFPQQNLDIQKLMNIMINNIEVQEFMFRITDRESDEVQEIRNLCVNYKASKVGRQQYLQSQEKPNLQQPIQEEYNEEEKLQVISKEEILSLQSPPSRIYRVVEQDELLELVNRSKFEFDQTKIDEAYKYAYLAQQKYKSDPRFQEHADYIESIIFEYDYMVENVRELDSDGWILDGVTDGISVKYKFPENTSTASMLMETKIPVNAIRVLSLVNEVDLNPLWVPFCKRTSVNKILNRACKVCTSEMYFPLIPNRECVFLGEGYDRLNVNGTITLVSRTIDNDKMFLEKNGIEIPEKSKFVRLHFKFYIFEITPIDKDSCSIRACTNVNPHISLVPNSVLAYIGRKFAHILIGKIVSYAKNFEKSPFYPVYQEHIEFYDWLEEKLRTYLKY